MVSKEFWIWATDQFTGDTGAGYSSPYLSPASDQASRNIIGLQFELCIRLTMSFSQAFRLTILDRVPHLCFHAKKSFSRDSRYSEQSKAANPKHIAYVSAASREKHIVYVKCINSVMTFHFNHQPNTRMEVYSSSGQIYKEAYCYCATGLTKCTESKTDSSRTYSI